MDKVLEILRIFMFSLHPRMLFCMERVGLLFSFFGQIYTIMIIENAAAAGQSARSSTSTSNIYRVLVGVLDID